MSGIISYKAFAPSTRNAMNRIKANYPSGVSGDDDSDREDVVNDETRSHSGDENETIEERIRREVGLAKRDHMEKRVELIQSFCWNTPRPTTPLTPQQMALCFVLSVADSAFSGDPDVIADTFMQRVADARYTKQVITLLDRWDNVTGGSLQSQQTRTQLVRSRFKNTDNDRSYNFLRYIGDIKETIFLPWVSFDDTVGGRLHLEFSPECFYCGRHGYTQGEKPFSMVVVCDENILRTIVRMVLAVKGNDELRINPLSFDENFFLMDSTCEPSEKVSVNGCEVSVGESMCLPSTDQFNSLRTDDQLHAEDGFLSSFYAYKITNRREWDRRREEARKNNRKAPLVPTVVSDFWDAIRRSAIGGFG